MMRRLIAAGVVIAAALSPAAPAAAEWVGIITAEEPPFYGRPTGRISIGTGIEVIGGVRHICTYYFDSPMDCRPLDNPSEPEPDDEWTWTLPELWFLNY